MILPTEILDSYCEKRCLGKPRYNGDKIVRVDHKDYTLEEFGRFTNSFNSSGSLNFICTKFSLVLHVE